MSSDSLQIVLTQTVLMYGDCLKKSARNLLKNWIIIPASVVAYIILILLAIPLAHLGMAGGFILGFIQIALLAFYYSWISETCRGSKVTTRDLLEFSYAMFFQVLSVAFIFFIVDFVLRSLLLGIEEGNWLLPCVNLGIVIVFNAIPEIIHQERLEGLLALQHAAVFTKENWIEWFLPLVVLLLPSIFLFSPEYVLLSLARAEPLLPVLTVIENIRSLSYFHGSGYLFALAGIVLGNWFMIFRGQLFIELRSGSRRQRIFKARQ